MKLIKNAKIFGYEGINDLAFDEKILFIGKDEGIYQQKAQEIIDAKGLDLLPGLIDVHVHLREPGFENKETIYTGTLAAAHGGFTSICAMPNVIPYPDNCEQMAKYLELINKNALVKVAPHACITCGEKGEKLVDFANLHNLGIRYFSDDGVGVASEELMKEAMKEAKKTDSFIVAHTEDMSYRKPNSCVHEGFYSQKLGLVGIPSECESKQLMRDINLLKETKCKYHACHISSALSVKALKEAKELGLDISAEVTAHHLLLEDKDVKNANFKMNPPLRSHEDRMELINALENGVIDFIANDHAPHTKEEKSKGIIYAPFGVVSLETAFSLLFTEFIHDTKRWTLEQLVNFMSKKPAKRFGFDDRGELSLGKCADMFLVDLAKKYTIKSEDFLSKGKNTPFENREVYAQIQKCFVDGRLVYMQK